MNGERGGKGGGAKERTKEGESGERDSGGEKASPAASSQASVCSKYARSATEKPCIYRTCSRVARGKLSHVARGDGSNDKVLLPHSRTNGEGESAPDGHFFLSAKLHSRHSFRARIPRVDIGGFHQNTACVTPVCLDN